mmetsp:Transcript_512/g.1228  ORF Transcript_512/g.1228 Transcript_512/m.1228 type:complete len:481 (-) Transcript_512:462-1904(-)
MESLQNSGKENDKPLLVATGETLESFQEDVQYLWCPSDIPVYEEPPSAIDFLRKHVAMSRPCIIRNSIIAGGKSRRGQDEKPQGDTGPRQNATGPLQLTLDDLVRCVRAGNEGSVDGSVDGGSSMPPLCVDVTPDGHGDCLRKVIIDNETTTAEKVFVKPMGRNMTISNFCRRLRRGRAKQQQEQKANRKESLDRVFASSSGSEEAFDEVDCDETDSDFWEDCVLYYSRQNDCLREELSPLWNLKSASNAAAGNDDNDDSYLFPRSFPWAEEAFFGNQTIGMERGPDAVNLWMGDERAVSAMHKDHYENLFYVLSGEKIFGLCPPSDAPFLYEREVTAGQFRTSKPCESSSSSRNDNEKGEETNRRWSVVLDREEDDENTSRYSKVHWIAADLFGKDDSNKKQIRHNEEFPLSRYAHPITVRVRAGELLYLPSLWFHRVTQTCETIGINYWYDMNFESPMWCYFHFLQQLRLEKQHSKRS